MKFITTLKIFLTIFALIQLSFSAHLESKSKSKVATESKNTATVSAQTENKLKNKSNLSTSSKIKAESTNKLKTGAELKTNAKSKNNLNSKRSNIIDINNLFNPNFDSKSKDNAVADKSKTVVDATSNTNSNETTAKSNQDDKSKKPEKNTNEILADWLMISSETFRDKSKFPDIYIRQTDAYIKIRTDNMDFRINDAHKKELDQEGNAPNNENCFWFRLSGLNIYYSSTVSDINILGSISIATVVGLINLENDHSGYYCFIIKDNGGVEWKVCSTKIAKRNTWVCAIQAALGVTKEAFCNGGTAKDDVKIIDHNVK